MFDGGRECFMLDPRRAQAILDCLKPIPIVETLGFRVVEFDEGYCKAVLPHDVRYDGIFGSFHGGLLTTVADSAACFAVMTQTGPDQPLTTTDIQIRFLAACLTDVTAVARVIKLGRTLCPVHVDLFDAAGAHVAVATVTYMRLDKRPNQAKR
jgi:uncharacterized protein (TIGR00369 family)